MTYGRFQRLLSRSALCGLFILIPAFCAQAQDTAGLGTTNGLPPGYATNPFANPSWNPWLNPYARTGVMDRDQLFLSLLAARQQVQVAEMAQKGKAPSGGGRVTTNSMMRPGGIAAGSYFGRGRAAAEEAPSRYGRYDQYFLRARR